MRIKLFEKFIGEDEEIQDLDEIFTSLDLDYDVEVLCFRRNDIENKLIKVFSVGLYFESKTEIKDILNQVWLRVSMARNMGFETYNRFCNRASFVPKKDYEFDFWGHLKFKRLRSELKSKVLLNDKSFTGNSLLPEIEGLYSDREYRLMDLDPYQRFDKNYKIVEIILHFKKN